MRTYFEHNIFSSNVWQSEIDTIRRKYEREVYVLIKYYT